MEVDYPIGVDKMHWWHVPVAQTRIVMHTQNLCEQEYLSIETSYLRFVC